MVCIVHDEHPLHVELDAVALLPIPQVKRRTARQEQQGGVFQLALNPIVGPSQRVLEIVTNVLVELFVFLFRDLLLGPCP